MIDLSGFTSKLTISKSSTESATTSKSGKIEFVCHEEIYNVIPEPIPANNILPEWYKQLEGKLGEGLSQSTVKRCAPFLDALTTGWIIPLGGEIEFSYNEETGDYSASQNFRKQLIDTHDPEQIGGENNPFSHLPILKFMNHWAIKVPKGYSVLIMSPLNRFDPRFEPFAGIVDADEYFNLVNFPTIWTGGSYHGVIEKGTPLVQVIPIKRDTMIGDGSIRSMTNDEHMYRQKEEDRVNSEESFYRNNIWKPKNASRVKDREKKETGTSNCPFH